MNGLIVIATSHLHATPSLEDPAKFANWNPDFTVSTQVFREHYLDFNLTDSFRDEANKKTVSHSRLDDPACPLRGAKKARGKQMTSRMKKDRVIIGTAGLDEKLHPMLRSQGS